MRHFLKLWAAVALTTWAAATALGWLYSALVDVLVARTRQG